MLGVGSEAMAAEQGGVALGVQAGVAQLLVLVALLVAI